MFFLNDKDYNAFTYTRCQRSFYYIILWLAKHNHVRLKISSFKRLGINDKLNKTIKKVLDFLEKVSSHSKGFKVKIKQNRTVVRRNSGRCHKLALVGGVSRDRNGFKTLIEPA